MLLTCGPTWTAEDVYYQLLLGSDITGCKAPWNPANLQLPRGASSGKIITYAGRGPAIAKGSVWSARVAPGAVARARALGVTRLPSDSPRHVTVRGRERRNVAASPFEPSALKNRTFISHYVRVCIKLCPNRFHARVKWGYKTSDEQWKRHHCRVFPFVFYRVWRPQLSFSNFGDERELNEKLNFVTLSQFGRKLTKTFNMVLKDE